MQNHTALLSLPSKQLQPSVCSKRHHVWFCRINCIILLSSKKKLISSSSSNSSDSSAAEAVRPSDPVIFSHFISASVTPGGRSMCGILPSI
uniref:Uncharacterized protein n=1 Tax=Arundo donax TaxID=35708 RepID=A0A0A8ZXD2_ARUDO